MPVRHLSVEQLVAAGEGVADDAARAHLASCQRCSREALQFQRLLHVMATDELETPPASVTAAILAMAPVAPPRPTILERLQAVLRLDSGMGALAYGLRGGQGKGRQLLYDAGPYEIDLRLRPEGQGWWLIGQLLGDAESGTARLESVTPPAAEKESATPGTSDINELGEFEFRGLPGGAYRLILALPDSEVEISVITLE